MFYNIVWFIVALACTQYDFQHRYLFDIQGTLETMALHVSCYLEEEVFLNNIFEPHHYVVYVVLIKLKPLKGQL